MSATDGSLYYGLVFRLGAESLIAYERTKQ